MDRKQGAVLRIVLLLALSLGLVAPLAAQSRPLFVEMTHTADGHVLDYPANGVWRRRAAQVRANRARLLLDGAFSVLNAPSVSAPTAVMGAVGMPTLMVGWSDSDTTASPKASRYDSLYYGNTPLPGRTYSLNSFYQEMSNGLLSVTGSAHGWYLADVTRNTMMTACSTGQPTDCGTGRQMMRNMFVKALTALDSSVDFGQFDNDGPDGVPNSGDDDGYVDVVQFVQPVLGAECGGPGIGGHKWFLGALGGAYTTGDSRAGGGQILVDAYHIISGVGGAGESPSNYNGCGNSALVAGIGTAAHEFGHGIGLPDLYDVSLTGEGIGEWGLMGSGNYTSANSPAQYDAWSKEQVGWVSVVSLTNDSTYTLAPVVTNDTVYVVRPPDANPRGEYFVLSNRQALGSDTAGMLHGGQSGPKVGGLLIWHIDSLKLATAGNSVNVGTPQGVWLMQADGLGQLQSSSRGDAGDPYPGSSNNTSFSYNTSPSSDLNNGTPTWITVDSITQVVPNGAMSFRLSFGRPSLIAASDTGATILLDSTPYNRFQGVLSPGTVHVLEMDSVQTVGGSRWTWLGWSDGQVRSHSFTASASGDTIIASVRTERRIQVTATGPGSVSASTGDDLSAGVFYDDGTSISLTSVPAAGNAFDHWQWGSLADTSGVLMITLTSPVTVSAVFVPNLAFAAPAVDALIGSAYQSTLVATGGTGSYAWQRTTGTLPAGLAFTATGRFTGTPTELGTFPITVKVTSGRQTLTADVTISITAPALAVDEAVAGLVGDSTLSASQIAYLDLLGNQNGLFDLGDFLAWVEATGATPSAEVMSRVLRQAGGAR